ncbi:hypothetical protein BU230_36740 [Klebsiella pneumoniae]|jgi:hypothetical protein|nr:hypothetical protein BU230_36740 [Klebsiella pneumoniae]
MTLLCHDKVRRSTRELRDEPLPVVSDLPFLLKTSRKTSRNLTKLRHWLPLQHPVNLSDLLHGVFYNLKLLDKRLQEQSPPAAHFQDIQKQDT